MPENNAKSTGKKGYKNPPAEHRFTPQNQPDRQARSAGQKRRWDRKNMLDSMADVLADPVEVEDKKSKKKKKIPGTEYMAMLMKRFVLNKSDKKPMTPGDFDRAVKLFELLGVKAKTVEVHGDVSAEHKGTIVVDANTAQEAMRRVLNDCLADPNADE